MPDTSATPGYGVLLKRNTVQIAEIRDISGPGLSLSFQEVTNLSSTDGWREYIATLLEMTEVTFDLNFLPANATQSYAAGLIKDLVDRTKQAFSITFSNTGATVWSFNAFVTKFSPSAPVEGKLSASVTLRPTGKPTLA